MHGVHINVYSMSEINSYTGCLGLGIYHSGVEVNGIEYAYGGHQFDTAGIFSNPPKTAPGPIVFLCSVPIGATEYTTEEIITILREMAHKYKGNRYHLLTQNCNHFVDEFVWKLTRQRAPGWINRLAGLAVTFHCCLPRWLVPPLEPPRADDKNVRSFDGPSPFSSLDNGASSPPPASYLEREKSDELLLRPPALQGGFSTLNSNSKLQSNGAAAGNNLNLGRGASLPVLPPAPPGKAKKYQIT